MYCSNCGKQNDKEGNFCNSCGSKLVKGDVEDNNEIAEIATSPLESKMSEVTVLPDKNLITENEFALYLGKNSEFFIKKWRESSNYNNSYYNQSTRIFKNSDLGPKGSLGWNWPAFFLGVHYLAYRKMYAMLALFWGLFIAVDIISVLGQKNRIGKLFFWVNDTWQGQLTFAIISGVLIAIYCNAQLFWESKKRIKKIKEKYKQAEDIKRELKRLSKPGWNAVILNVIIFGIYSFFINDFLELLLKIYTK